MKAIQIDSFGLENIQYKEIPDPAPVESSEVLVRFRAASLNYRDYLVVTGKYNPKFPLPLIPCSDGAGEVVEIGKNIKNFSVGDRVCATFAPNWDSGKPTKKEIRASLGGPLDGTLREYAVLPESGLVKIPSHLSFEEGATLPCAALTAWSALFGESPVLPGESVVIQGTGGVSIFALQFAKLAGAKVILTSSSDEKLSQGRKLGADFLINYKTDPKWSKKVREFTNGEGADHIVEVGGAGTLDESIQSVKLFGSIYLIGVLSGSSPSLNLLPIVMGQVKIQGIVIGPKKSFEKMNRAITENSIHPVIDKIFPLEETRRAIEYLRDGKHFGKIVITI
ncbi:MAG: NAD(P)-dependent alcohol dehydrogenase [Leptospiraceae bacterium]|nr:NAD(P)-dependent alcohol dehydrogenase [Leptospiraceae bacterium]MCK6381374.1 NAD(P)-dependent alcohol dehydrogenase [Leptospiraceae bacterium]NUM41168.1 NAD(P)-dependent alcohol dehydrogenase [Leptospiraceae bacterium]